MHQIYQMHQIYPSEFHPQHHLQTSQTLWENGFM